MAFSRQAFDVVFNCFTSFGYFDEPTDHVQVVSNIAECDELRDIARALQELSVVKRARHEQRFGECEVSVGQRR